jgi:Cu+-exporting ATPase
MEKVVLKVGGMTCSSCAQGIARHLEKKGMTNVHIDYESGMLELDTVSGIGIDQIVTAINSLGYSAGKEGEEKKESKISEIVASLDFRFGCSLLLTLPLFFHMFMDWHFLHLPLLQFILATPVMLIGLLHFGRSAWGSLKSGSPNMDVLITLGSSAAYIYSCFGWYLHFGEAEADNYLFFETSATIITLLLLGNIIERRSLKKTQSALEALIRIQPQTARIIENALTAHETSREIAAAYLRVNDLILINTGEKIPADGVIYEGKAGIDQSMMTGESMPVEKTVDEVVMCGTIVLSGHIKVLVQHAGSETILSRMIETVKKSALQKPEIQRIGDQVSAWFVPIVIAISIITFLLSFFYLDLPASESLLRSIAVLVISCPCAMGLATPTAVAVGIGRSAKNGILVKGGETMERLQQIDTIVFDKTGTLTEGKISIKKINFHADKSLVGYLLGTLEQYSTHPLATTLSSHFSAVKSPFPISFSEIKEVPGSGIKAVDKAGNIYKAGSAQFTGMNNGKEQHQVYLTLNNELLSEIDFEDAVRPDARELVQYFKQNGIKTVLLSGDRIDICDSLAKELEIEMVYAEKLPHEKEAVIRELQLRNKLAMVGDGINDASSLALASVGIAMNSGSEIAKQTAEIVLVGKGELKALIQIHLMSKHTIRTIRQNLFWALLYNIVAIPMAAVGLLSPMIASLSMAFSDVIVIGNSLRLRFKKLQELR